MKTELIGLGFAGLYKQKSYKVDHLNDIDKLHEL